ncbi:MAG: TldD/PmbA family protein [Pseudomonadota bacterium]|nr:TldD/PmbA family protein [Pseudomonadota bacterium]
MPTNWQPVIDDFKAVVPSVDFWSLRLVHDETETLHVRDDVVQPPSLVQSRGVYISFIDRGGMAYAATSALNREGLRAACEEAFNWLAFSHRHALIAADSMPRPERSGSYATPVQTPWEAWSLKDKLERLQDINRQLNIDEAIVDRQAQLSCRRSEVTLLTSDGVSIDQQFHYIIPGYAAVANQGAQTQMRTGGGWGSARQGGLEQLAAFDFPDSARQVAEQAIALVNAPECPNTTADLLLMPSQMMLQIHESIGHPLELDRILGDERNYAGTSFVSLDMFGSYRYGSELLNVTFDPGIAQEMASYAFDDEGTPAERSYLIRDGILERPLGGAVSQARADISGVANARASDWNRPAIDRMANLNLEPGTRSLDELIGSIETGVLMDTNRSWSIDDSRNKFQFGCELGRLIENGELKGLVRNPNYRGISATFWRNLVAVGDAGSFEVWGTPYCGKGEPNQMVQVGHASPACVFRDVEIFGGE